MLLHESPQTSAGFIPLMEELGSRFTTIALDTAGFGLSDPLPVERPELVDYAKPTAATIEALGLGPVPVHGNHTGPLIALELARRVPDIVAAAILDGLPMCSEEAPELVAHYAPPFTPAFDGSHLLLAWARHRDGFVHFLWYRCDAEHRLDLPMPASAALQRRLLDGLRPAHATGSRSGRRFATGRSGRFPRRGHRSPWCVAPMTCRRAASPACLRATPPRRSRASAGSLVSSKPRSPIRCRTARRQSLLQRISPVVAPVPTSTAPPVSCSSAAPAPTMAVAQVSAPSSSFTARRVAHGCSSRCCTIDLPGYGDSDKPPARSATVGDFARILGEALDVLGLSGGDLYGTGTGAVVAVELAVERSDLVQLSLVTAPTLVTGGSPGLVPDGLLTTRAPAPTEVGSAHGRLRVEAP